MSQGYSTTIQHDPNHMITFDQTWNPYVAGDDDWSHYTTTDVKDASIYNENLVFENVLDLQDHLETLIHNENERGMMSPDSQMPGSTSDHSPLTDQMISSPTAQTFSSTVPVCTQYPGDYGFQVALEKQQKKTKSANWIFFDGLDKLFVKINKPCPFLFRSAKKPPLGSIIRALPVYLNPEHIQEVVSRCPTHRAAKNALESSTLAQHLILSEHQLAKHVEDPYTHRLSVIIPYEDPQAGAEWVTNLYKFMCFSSCHSGYSRRPLHVIFTLEFDGAVLGRQVIKVRCCASPGRDGCQEEENLLGKKSGKKRMMTSPIGDDVATLTPDVKRQRCGKREEIFTIQVRGRENYETLRHLRDSLELVDHLPLPMIAQFRQQQMELDKWILNGDQGDTDSHRTSPTTPLPTTMPASAAAPPVPSSGKVKKRSHPIDSLVPGFDYVSPNALTYHHQTNAPQLFY